MLKGVKVGIHCDMRSDCRLEVGIQCECHLLLGLSHTRHGILCHPLLKEVRLALQGNPLHPRKWVGRSPDLRIAQRQHQTIRHAGKGGRAARREGVGAVGAGPGGVRLRGRRRARRWRLPSLGGHRPHSRKVVELCLLHAGRVGRDRGAE